MDGQKHGQSQARERQGGQEPGLRAELLQKQVEDRQDDEQQDLRPAEGEQERQHGGRPADGEDDRPAPFLGQIKPHVNGQREEGGQAVRTLEAEGRTLQRADMLDQIAGPPQQVGGREREQEKDQVCQEYPQVHLQVASAGCRHDQADDVELRGNGIGQEKGGPERHQHTDASQRITGICGQQGRNPQQEKTRPQPVQDVPYLAEKHRGPLRRQHDRLAQKDEDEAGIEQPQERPLQVRILETLEAHHCQFNRPLQIYAKKGTDRSAPSVRSPENYSPGAMASHGQTPAQVPQSMQTSASML